MIFRFCNNVVYTTKKLIVYTHVHDGYKSTLFLITLEAFVQI